MKYTCLLLIFLIRCSPIEKEIIYQNLPDRSDEHFAPFAVFELDTLDNSAHQIIGEVEIKDSGFSLQE